MSPADVDIPGKLPTGLGTMSPAMAEMRAYPRYLFEKVSRDLGSRVWEIGVGHGNYTAWLVQAGKSVLATDVDADCVLSVERQFRESGSVVTANVDLTDPVSIHAQKNFRADSLLCFNVLEHIEDDVSALQWLRESVAPHAKLALIVPAHPKLFGRMDQEAGHFRRYTRRSLSAALVRAGWIVERLRYLNLCGACGWWYHNRVRKQAGLTDESVNRQMRSIDRWLPLLAKFTDPLFGSLAGLSVMAIANAGHSADFGRDSGSSTMTDQNRVATESD